MATKIVPKAKLPEAPPEGWKLWARRFLRNRSAVWGAVIVAIFLLVALVGQLMPYDPTAQNLSERLLPPSLAHPLGTDDLGRDLGLRIVAGAWISLQVGLISVAIALILGTALGTLAGYAGKWVDETVMRVIDVMMAFPGILLAILIVAIMGPSLTNAMIAIGLVNVPVYARLIRASVLGVKSQEFVEAAHASGASHVAIVFRHVLPNCLTPLMVQATLGIATAILETAGLSFLGLGAQPPIPEWGTMLNNARAFIRSAPWTVTFPGLAIMLVVLGFNLLGDGLRDLLDPKTRRGV
ncbi:Glutathione transport system permease protein GsiD [compost metagenome]